MNGYPYWRFRNERWLTGKVSAFDLDAQGLFLHFCMTAWAAHGSFTLCSTSVTMRFRKPAEWVSETVATMCDVGILVRDGDKYRIKFIDEQLAEMHAVRAKRIKAGKASSEARNPSPTPPSEEREDAIEGKVSSVLSNAQHVLNTCSTHGPDKSDSPKRAYGEFHGVKLTDDEYANLTAKHGASRLAQGIAILDDYMRSKGKRYKDHYATLKETSWVWQRVDERNGQPRQAQPAPRLVNTWVDPNPDKKMRKAF